MQNVSNLVSWTSADLSYSQISADISTFNSSVLRKSRKTPLQPTSYTPPMTNIDFHKNLFQYYGVVEPWFYTVTQELICYFATDLETLHSMNDRSLNPLLLIFQLQFSCTLDIRCEHVFDNILNVEKLTCLLLNSLFSKDKIVVSFDKINKIFAENHNSRFYSRSILIKRHLFVALKSYR